MSPDPILAGSEIQKSAGAPLSDAQLSRLHADILFASSIASYLRYNRTSDSETLRARRAQLKSLLLSISEAL